MTKRHKLVKKTHKNQISKVIVKITKSNYLNENAGDDLRPNRYHCVEIHQSAAQFNHILHEIGNRVCGCQWT